MEETRDCHTQRVQDFSRVTQKYFGSPIEIEKYSGNYLYIKGRAVRLHYTTLSYITAFYEWRMHNEVYGAYPIIDVDFNFFADALHSKTMNIEAVAAVLNVSDASLRYNYKEIGDIKEAYSKVLSGRRGAAETFTWGDFTGTSIEWSNRLHISPPAFRARLYSHGVCHLLFMTVAEYAATPASVKESFVGTRVKKVYAIKGRTAPKEMGQKPTKKDLSKREEAFEYGSAVRLITALIADSKDNLIIGREPYFTDSVKFLLNKNGLLQHYLECVAGVDVEECLEELRIYATHKYKEHKVAINRRKTPHA